MDHDHGMPGMGGGMMPSPSQSNVTGGNSTSTMMHRHKMMMHMTFFWGSDAEILFSGWPGTRPYMYAISLVVIFLLAFVTEWLSHCSLISPGSSHVSAGLIQTVLHFLRVGLAYLVMLAVMSFNGGVFLVAVFGHTLGFMFFGSKVFKKRLPDHFKTSDLPPLSTC